MEDFCKLFLLHYRQYLCQEYRYKCDKSNEDNLATCIEKYRRYTEKCSERVDDGTDLALCEPELEQTEVEVEGLVTLHRVRSLHDASHHNVDEVDEVDTEDRNSGSDFASCDDRERSNQEGKHDGSRVAHDESSRDICSSEEIGRWDDDSEDHEEEAAILLAGFGRVSEVELERESTEDEEGDERKSTRESRNSIRKIHCIEYDHIPEYRDDEREVVERDIPIKDIEVHKEVIETSDTTEDVTHIRNLDTRETDDSTNPNLHDETYYRGYTEWEFPDSVHIIEKTHECDPNTDSYHDREPFLEERREVSVEEYERTHHEEHEEDDYSGAVWSWFSPLF